MNRVAQALGSLFVAFYNSQGYGGGILTAIRAGTNDRILLQIGHDHFLPHSFSLLFAAKIWQLLAGLDGVTSREKAEIKFSSWQLNFASTVSPAEQQRRRDSQRDIQNRDDLFAVLYIADTIGK
jgi:hypothetical protein